jgi:hypothetical protein
MDDIAGVDAARVIDRDDLQSAGRSAYLWYMVRALASASVGTPYFRLLSGEAPGGLVRGFSGSKGGNQ